MRLGLNYPGDRPDLPKETRAYVRTQRMRESISCVPIFNSGPFERPSGLVPREAAGAGPKNRVRREGLFILEIWPPESGPPRARAKMATGARLDARSLVLYSLWSEGRTHGRSWDYSNSFDAFYELPVSSFDLVELPLRI